MRCVYKILYLNTLSIRFNNKEKKEMCMDFPILIRNQRFEGISIGSKEIEDIKESYQISAIRVVKIRYFI